MHLKHLEVVGFKSFADTIHLDMEPGITAVVGPNGCGKSNIMDAVRWCLGEMSAKSLRSSAMMDVVFNGSGARPPQNMAEVTLTFDNSDKRLPIDFNDVSISRRLFRSGESEYFINKTQCRLRDIRELFLDTGMGEDGYSSLEQGKVEWILQAKPEERRELFEEAAGVSKYRARREEALRKLERVEVDLSRLADIISVTTDQVKKLESAVNKAKTYQRIREELKTMEVNDWLFQLTTSDTELAAVQENLLKVQTTSEELNTKAHQMGTQVAESRLELTQLEEELLNANTALNTIDSNIKIGEERLNNAKQRQQDIKNQRVNTIENVTREEARIEELKVQREVLAKALEEIKQAGASIESGFEESKNIFDQTAMELGAKNQESKDIRELILSRADQRQKLQQQMNTASSDAARLTSQAESIEKERNRFVSLLAEVSEKIIAGENQANELKAQLAEKTNELANMTSQFRGLEEQETSLRASILNQSEEIAKIKGQIDSIEDQQSSDPYLSGSQAVISEGLPGIHGPIGRLIQTEDIHQDIVAATIGEHLGDLVAETADDAERAIEFLRTEQKGRTRIWILEKLEEDASDEYVGAMPRGNTLFSCIRTDIMFRPLLKHLCASMWVQGTSVYGQAVVNGGMDPSQWQSHITHRAPELEKALSAKEAQKARLEAQLAQVDASMIQLAQQKEAGVKETEEVRIRLELAMEDLARIAAQRQTVEEEQLSIDLDLERIDLEKEKANTIQAESLAEFNRIQAEERDNHDRLEALQHTLTELQQIHAKASADLSAQEEKLKGYQEKVTWQTSIVDHNERELNGVTESLERHRQSLNDFSTQIEMAEQSEKDAEALIQTSLQERQTAAEVCAAIQAKRVERTETVQGLEAQLSKIRTELNAVQEEIQNEMIKETNIKNRLESVSQRLQDHYEMTIEQAKAQFVTPVAADPETLDRLKKRVANIGPINLAAPQEHAELLEKSTFLTTQQADLLKAKDDLKQVITKINATTKEHFRETFDKVRENFRALYSTLFQGGEADLRFTDETDILNTGVDIFCQPPGKKLLHISLLSGGEKALTAIALLFAFFQVRPSPVALMDEVDAPLDEANVLRYVEMIKRFSENSQFLLITHNKRTMEAANNLYGVTMEELGVSKVLSARLSKKEKSSPAKEETAAAV